MKIKEMKVPVEEHDHRFDEEEDDDEGSYIEISLEDKPGWDKAENIFQFRLSFSTMLPRNSDSGGSFRRKFLMSAESVKSTSSENYIFSSDASCISSCSSSSEAVLGRSNARRNPSEMLLMLNLSSSPENTKLYDGKTNIDAQKRKRSKAREVINNGLIKLIIKFRTIKARSKNILTRTSNHISGTQYVTHNTDRLRYTCYESPVIEPVSATERNKSNLPQVSINSIKGMIDSLTVSCPASIKTSPVHRNYCGTASTIKTYSRENAIQAAIAHCKMSLDQAVPVSDVSIREK